MREIKAMIEGLSPLLMHNIAGMKRSSGGKKNVVPGDEDYARDHAYWLDEQHSSLAVPARNIHASFLGASAKFKVGRSSLKSLISSAIHVGPELISLNKKDYIIDVQSVNIQKNRVYRARAKVWPWSALFSIFFDDEWISIEVMQITMPDLIQTAGKTVGTMDFRPQKNGSYGTYRLVRYELLPAGKQELTPEPEILGFPGQEKSKRRAA
jgi:hypothetical protein